MFNESATYSPRKYDDWFVVDETDFMASESSLRPSSSTESYQMLTETSTTADSSIESTSKSHFSNNSDFESFITDKIDKINKETTEEVKRIKIKMSEIESLWESMDANKSQKSEQHHPQLNEIDRLLEEARREAEEIHKGANMAVQELTKSVENVEELCSKGITLKDSADNFRKTASTEKSLIPLPFKTKMIIGITVFLTCEFLLRLI
uniref:Uncharacterized protein n=1 Tax=Theileria annulata TaxID=5874 RepID=A0A3B0MVJ1_THEAN